MSYSVQSFVGSSNYIKEIRNIILSVCNNTASVLITGERGTGKDLFAKVVHVEGKKNPADYLTLNCKLYKNNPDSVIPAIKDFINLNQSEKTIYLCNIEKLSLTVQEIFIDLLKEIRTKQQGVRFIFSSEENLEELVEAGEFSRDLYFQISTVLVNLLPLRQHKEDIPEIAAYYFKYYNKTSSKEFKGFSEPAKIAIINNFWSGNVAELKNAIERCFLVGNPPYIKANDLAIKNNTSLNNAVENALEDRLEDKSLKNALDSFKKSYVTKVLEESNWNQTKAAKVLGIQRTYVIRLINELQIRKK